MNVTLCNMSGTPDYFSFGSTAVTSTTINQASNPRFKEAPYSTFQAILTGTSGALTGTVTIQASNEDMTGMGQAVLANTATSTALTAGSQTNFDFVTVGMLVIGPGIPAGTYVATKTNNTTLVLSASTTATTTSPVEVKFFNTNWNATVLGTITLTGTIAGGIPSFTDGFSVTSTWKYVRANVTNVTGIGATVQVIMGL
jgi:hypothetical protein